MKAEYKRQLAVTGLVVLLVCVGGAVLIAVGIGKYDESRTFRAMAASAPGRVVGFERYDAPGADIQDDIDYALVVFTSADGREVRFRGPSKDGPVTLHKGDQVRVLYEPANPENAKVDSFMGLWFAATALCTLGASAILIPLLTLWQAWRWCQRQ